MKLGPEKKVWIIEVRIIKVRLYYLHKKLFAEGSYIKETDFRRETRKEQKIQAKNKNKSIRKKSLITI